MDTMVSESGILCPDGFRRMTPGIYAAAESAAAFHGLPPGVRHWDVLIALDRAAAPLGFGRAVIDTLRLLFNYTRPTDWEHDAVPLVWPSNDMLMDQIGLSLSGLKKRLRALAELGLIAFRDSPNGRRYGRRDAEGRIVLDASYGIDLSPAAALYEVALDAAAAHEAERRQRASLRRRRTSARRALVQLLAAAREHGAGQVLPAAEIAAALHMALQVPLAAALEALEAAVAQIEDLWSRAYAVFRDLVGVDGHKPGWVSSEAHETGVESMKSDPKGALEGPLLQITTEPPFTTVNTGNAAQQPDRSAPNDRAKPDRPRPGSTPRPRQVSPPPRSGSRPKDTAPPTTRTHTSEYDHGLAYIPLRTLLAVIPPEIAEWLPAGRRPSWAQLVDLIHMHLEPLGISRQAWSMACAELGRYGAAVAVAIIAAKREEIDKPDRYLRSMAYRAAEGDLRLHQSVWGLTLKRRQQAEGAA